MTVEAYTEVDRGAALLFAPQAQIRQFIVCACNALAYEFVYMPHGVLRFCDNTTGAELLGLRAVQGVCFSPEYADAQTEYVTVGHPLLDKLFTMVKRRGSTTSLLFTYSLDPTFLQAAISYDPKVILSESAPHALRRLWMTMGRLHFINTKSRVLKARAVNQLQILFYFRVSCVSDEKLELLIPVLIDPTTELPTPWMGLNDTVFFVPPVHTQHAHRQKSQSMSVQSDYGDELLGLDALKVMGQKVLPHDSYTVMRLYGIAAAFLEHQVDVEIRAFTAAATQRLEQERIRIDEYYNDLAQEILDPLRQAFRRIASLSVRSQLTHSLKTQMVYAEQIDSMKQDAKLLETRYEQELERLAKEKALRVRELELKHESRIELHLVSMAAVHVPRLEYTFRLHGVQRREITFVYDVLCDRILDLTCEACDHPLQETVLCSCGDVVCTHCSDECTCGKTVCAHCKQGSCHICGRLLCEDCTITCPMSSQEPTWICSECYRKHCAECCNISSVMF